MLIRNLLEYLLNQDTFELRIYFSNSKTCLYTGAAKVAEVPAELINKKVKCWTTTRMIEPTQDNKPYNNILYVETYLKAKFT
jgi:hypothetical protein